MTLVVLLTNGNAADGEVVVLTPRRWRSRATMLAHCAITTVAKDSVTGESTRETKPLRGKPRKLVNLW